MSECGMHSPHHRLKLPLDKSSFNSPGTGKGKILFCWGYSHWPKKILKLSKINLPCLIWRIYLAFTTQTSGRTFEDVNGVTFQTRGRVFIILPISPYLDCKFVPLSQEINFLKKRGHVPESMYTGDSNKRPRILNRRSRIWN